MQRAKLFAYVNSNIINAVKRQRNLGLALWLLASLCTSAKREVEGLRENRSVIECTPLSEGKMVMNE